MVFQNCRYTYIWYTHCINVNIHVYTNIYTVIYSCIINTVLRSTSKELPSTLRHLSQVGMLSVLNQSPFFARWPGKMFQPLKIQESYISTYMIYIYIYLYTYGNMHFGLWCLLRSKLASMNPSAERLPFTPLDLTDFEDWRALHEQWSGQTRVIQVGGIADGYGYCWSSACVFLWVISFKLVMYSHV